MVKSSQKYSDLPKRRQPESSRSSDRPSENSLAQRYSFKRNRTLTGSVSPHVASASETNAQRKSSRVQAHDLTRHRRHIGVILVMVLLASTILLILVSQFTARATVRTSDVSFAIDPVYRESIDAYLGRQPIERLRFMMDERALSEYVKSINPEVASVKSEGFAGLGKSLFVIEMRAPIAGWSINGNRHFVDAAGESFARNYFAKPPVQIVDNSGIQVAAGQAVASNQFLGFVGRIVGKTNAMTPYVATKVVIPQGTTRQIELHLKGIAYPIKLSIDRLTGEQVEDMATAVQWLSRHDISPKYLDVRVSGRAFYR